MPQPSDLAWTFTGRPVLDETGLPLGSISDIVYDDAGRPEYVVVDPGIFRAAKCVPIQGSYGTSRGELVVAIDRTRFREAPKAADVDQLSALGGHGLQLHDG